VRVNGGSYRCWCGRQGETGALLIDHWLVSRQACVLIYMHAGLILALSAIDGSTPSCTAISPRCTCCQGVPVQASTAVRRTATPAASAAAAAAAAAAAVQVLPIRACSGIESSAPGCTDAAGEYIWSNAWHESQQLGFNYSSGAPDWGLWINAPNRRGVHQASRLLLHDFRASICFRCDMQLCLHCEGGSDQRAVVRNTTACF
jgi:hypothetical protein